jgi:hypothetical protein
MRLTMLRRSTVDNFLQGAHSIFGLTMPDFQLAGQPEEMAKREKHQVLNIAKAASKISTLEHYVQHTLPSGVKMAGVFVGHLEVRSCHGVFLVCTA